MGGLWRQVIENFLQGEELQAVIQGMEGVRGGRGAHLVSETVRNLMDDERM